MTTDAQELQRTFDLRWKADQRARFAGKRTTGSKLCAEKIIEIRSLQGKMSQRQIGREFDMNQTTIGKILRREYWKHVP